jgi:protein-S-isoprenylcysteine O-methyltransferase Ste14
MNKSRASVFLERGGLWVLGQSVLMLGVIGLAVRYPGDWTQFVLMIAGLLLFALGGIIGIAGVLALKTNRTPFPKPCENSKLVQGGIYARMRHPLYTSVILASVGWAGLWQSWPAGLAALALIPFFSAKARREERWLREKFPDYGDYERRVPRFLPRLRRPPHPD